MHELDPLVPSLSRRGLLRSAGVLALGTGALGLAAGCSRDRGGKEPQSIPTSGPRLDNDQAEALAVARFGNYRAQRIPVTWTNPGGIPSAGAATIDYVSHLGWGTFGDEQMPMAWTVQRVATPAKQPYTNSDNWAGRAMAPATNQFDVLLMVMISLGSDRPENPQLLTQTDAMYLGSHKIGSEDCWVLKGPTQQQAATGSAQPSPTATNQGSSRTRYWVRKSDKRLLRFEAMLGDPQGRLARIDFEVDAPKPDGMPAYLAPVLMVREQTQTERNKQQGKAKG